ncbi:MAG TPA: biotin--[acetyl-CoA-carboxylase] ligase [Marmoricola sp.]|nr:biotin--[acetyl-CoA-carboxylase] ligase [Marmoricola sp.]
MPGEPASRPPLDRGLLARATGWRYQVVAESPSTNAELGARFRRGERPGVALVAEHQTAGRGRLDRTWVTPPRSSLTVSFLLDPVGVPVQRWPWLPLLTGVAVVEAVRRTAGPVAAGVALKWPNDVLCVGDRGDRKLAGILLERVEVGASAAAVVGVGLNVHQGADELPVAQATSLALEGAAVDRTQLLLALGDELGRRVSAWSSAGGEPDDVRASYLSRCVTPGRRVRVELPGQAPVEGEAVDVDRDGRLVVRTGTGQLEVGAGDVVHVRPEDRRVT